jgi:hypothetical protein
VSPAARRAARRVARQVKPTIAGREIADVEAAFTEDYAALLVHISTFSYTVTSAALFSDLGGCEPEAFAREVEKALSHG